MVRFHAVVGVVRNALDAELGEGRRRAAVGEGAPEAVRVDVEAVARAPGRDGVRGRAAPELTEDLRKTEPSL